MVDPQFKADVLAGLSGPRRAIPARWFYDERGSELFDDITRLEEYYPTRVETEILEKCCVDIAARVGAGRAVFEFGAGSATKTPLLLAAVAPTAYVPIDISGDYLRDAAAALQAKFPTLPVYPVEADFTNGIELPGTIDDLSRLGFFPGSTIGNFIPRSGVDMLRHMRGILGEGAMLLIGFDRIKPLNVMMLAYDDASGVTAAFNLNLLERINRELDGNIPISAFAHRAIWNDIEARVEMHLEVTRDIGFVVGGENFEMTEGETIHTENSHKYDLRSARLMLRAGGWSPVKEYSDPDDWFTLILAEAKPFHSAP
jgi:dimethylhistidine N-methyltransferase